MVRLRRLCSAIIDLCLFFIPLYLVYSYKELFFNGYSIAIFLVVFIVLIELKLRRERHLTDEEINSKSVDNFYFYPFLGRSLGMKIMGVYVVRGKYHLNLSDLEEWRIKGFIHTLISGGLFYFAMFFDSYGRTFYDLKLDVYVVDKKGFKQFGTHEDFEKDITKRSSIIKKDKK